MDLLITKNEKKDPNSPDYLVLSLSPKTAVAALKQQTKDLEEARPVGFKFDKESLRQDLLRKVYRIVLLEVILTFGLSALATYNESVKKLFLSYPAVVLGFEVFSVFLLLVTSVSAKIRRKHPINVVCLAFITFGFAGAVAFISAYFEHEIVFKAVVVTSIVIASLTLFTLQTKVNFFGVAPFVFIGLVVILCLNCHLIYRAFYHQHEVGADKYDEKVMMIFTYVGVIVFSLALVFHTQVLLGPRSNVEKLAEEHVFIALSLYTDIINLFLKMMFVV